MTVVLLCYFWMAIFIIISAVPNAIWRQDLHRPWTWSWSYLFIRKSLWHTCYIKSCRFLNTRILSHVTNHIILRTDNHCTSASRVVLSALLISRELGSINFSSTYSRTPPIHTLAIRKVNYPDRLGPPCKYFINLYPSNVDNWASS
jgi:hypothetical protein